MIGLQLLFTYLPVMQTAFGSRAIGAVDWLPILAGGLVISVAVEAEKAFRRSRSASSRQQARPRSRV